jgi:tetratricopeptide (TPR) repeat protein/DNA-binding winged helix-turn-helix (wHTH) protein
MLLAEGQSPESEIDSLSAMETITQLSQVVRFGLFEVDRRTSELRKDGVLVRLQHQPFEILLILLDHAGELVSRDLLRHELWLADTTVDFDHNLNKAMNKLRHALGDVAENPRFIETLQRKGYRFIAPVSASRPESVAISLPGDGAVPRTFALDSVPHSGLPLTAPIEAEPARKRWTLSATVWTAGVVAVAVFSLLAFFLYMHLRSASENTPRVKMPRRSVAVLEFRNLSGRGDEAWLATALSDWLTTDLSSGDQLRIPSSDNIARAERELSLTPIDVLNRESLSKIGRILNTDYVLVGTYGLVGSDSNRRIRLDLQLLNTRSGETVASISDTGTEADLFSVVSQVGGQLRDKLGIEGLTREGIKQVAIALPQNHDAARFYSQALDALRVFDAVSASEMLRKSIAMEPNYSLSHAALATVWDELGYDGRAQAEAKTALDLSTTLPRPEHLLVEGRYDELSKNWDRAIDVYRALFEVFPDSLDYGLALAHAQVGGGHGIEALATLDALRKLPAPLGEDPRLDLAEDYAAESLGDYRRDLSAATRAAKKARALGASLLLAQALADEEWALENLGQPDGAIAAAEESMKIFAQFQDKRGVAHGICAIGIMLLDKGDATGAKAKFEASLNMHRELGGQLSVAGDLNNLGEALMMLGKFDPSRRSFEQSLETYRKIGHEDGIALVKTNLGILLLATGELDQAKKSFEQALEICTRLGDQSKANKARLGMAEVFRAEGDFTNAQKYGVQALQGFSAIGDRSSMARAEISMAELLMDEGNSAQAASEARDAVIEFTREKEADNEAIANAILARTLLAQGKTSEAQAAMKTAEFSLRQCDRYEAKLVVEMDSALLHAKLGGATGNRNAVNALGQVLSEAKQRGFVNYVFESRLAIAQMDFQNSTHSAARAQLESLRQEAAAKGFGRIAHQAAAALGKNRGAS